MECLTQEALNALLLTFSRHYIEVINNIYISIE